MITIDHLYSALRPSLRGISAGYFRSTLRGLEPTLEMTPRKRTQLMLTQLRFRGEKSGDFRFQPGVNVLRAGNDKGKSSLLKLIHFCLTGKNDLKKDVDSWISQVELSFELDGVAHAITVDKKGRPRGRLVRGTFEDLASAEPLVEFRNGKQMQDRLEAFFNDAFGLRPLMGTQKDSRKGSDALLDAPTSYRAYFRGMYINQDLGYTGLLTDGLPYGNLFMKVLGMLLGIGGIDAFFAVEARLAHLENELGKEERYHRRVEESLGLRDPATLAEEMGKLERYIDELKVERTGLMVRATSDDADRRLNELTEQLVSLDDARLELAHSLREAEVELRTAERSVSELEAALSSHRALSAIQPDRCPVCEVAIAERRRFPRTPAGECLLCHEEMPEGHGEEFVAIAEERLQQAKASLATQRRAVEARRAEIDEVEVRSRQLMQQKRHLQAQLRSAHQGTIELDREIELETRYLGRLEAERESATRMVSEDGSSNIKKLLKRKKVLDAVLRHLRTLDAAANERRKREFSKRVQEYCTTIGFPGLEEVSLDAQLKPRIYQNGKLYTFEELSPGEKVRFVLAFYLALAIATGEDLEYGVHPGLLLIDSPGKEEMVHKDFEAVVELLSIIEDKHASTIQAIVATTIPAIRRATGAKKQVFIKNDDEPLFG